MSKSIMSNEYSCYVCGFPKNLHRHHIFGGIGRRELSEKNGCWCYLCTRHHNMSDFSVHSDRTLDVKLKRKCQEILEQEKGWTREQFISTFGRNYID